MQELLHTSKHESIMFFSSWLETPLQAGCSWTVSRDDRPIMCQCHKLQQGSWCGASWHIFLSWGEEPRCFAPDLPKRSNHPPTEHSEETAKIIRRPCAMSMCKKEIKTLPENIPPSALFLAHRLHPSTFRRTLQRHWRSHWHVCGPSSWSHMELHLQIHSSALPSGEPSPSHCPQHSCGKHRCGSSASRPEPFRLNNENIIKITL